jgi:predicted dehydrogenase
MTRRDFNKTATAIGAVAATRTLVTARAKGADEAAKDKPKRIKVGVIGCGSVSGVYLPHLLKCPYVELVSACDIIPERAAQRAKKFNIPHHYPHIDKMLSGAAFELLVDLTDMQEHGHLNREALESGKHV